MAQVLQFVPPECAFDSEVAAVLLAAYDKAILSLHDKGQPSLVREIIAKRIIEIGAGGERDPDKLCEAALARLGIISA